LKIRILEQLQITISDNPKQTLTEIYNKLNNICKYNSGIILAINLDDFNNEEFKSSLNASQLYYVNHLIKFEITDLNDYFSENIRVKCKFKNNESSLEHWTKNKNKIIKKVLDKKQELTIYLFVFV
jgi:hypothetical protein